MQCGRKRYLKALRIVFSMRTILTKIIKSGNLNQDIRTGRHCVFNLHVHLVFVTKYRRNVFTKNILDALKLLFESVCLDIKAELIEFDGEDDHVHLLVNYPPKLPISVLVNSLKGVSSRMIRKLNFPDIQKKLWGDALWSPSYFAGSCGGAPISIIRQYIENQRTPKDRNEACPLISPP